MMRKITRDAIQAFYNDEFFKRSNTVVNTGEEGTYLVLHSNLIAFKIHCTGKIFIRNCGRKSSVIKERLNGLKGVSIVQRKGEWYLNGELWDGFNKEIKEV